MRYGGYREFRRTLDAVLVHQALLDPLERFVEGSKAVVVDILVADRRLAGWNPIALLLSGATTSGETSGGARCARRVSW